MTDKEKIVSISNDDKELLHGFKVLGIFPFYLRHIRTGTRINLCLITDKIQAANDDKPINENTFYNTELLKKITPLINEYITIGLINERFLGRLLKPFIKAKVKGCDHKQIHGLYSKIFDLMDGSFFLSYCQHLMKKDRTILKEE